MYAIVEIAGQQFKVAKDQKIYVHRLQSKEGSEINFDKVMLLEDKGNVTIGNPVIEGVSVSAKILSHLKSDKVIVFKKKRRKGYKKKNSHRQCLSEIEIQKIVHSVTTRKNAKKQVIDEPKKDGLKKTLKKEDDFKKIEGIGPKISDILNANNIFTFDDLANTKIEKLKEILTNAGGHYASKNPSSWPKQAKMAADGKWDNLKQWQDNVKRGIE